MNEHYYQDEEIHAFDITMTRMDRDLVAQNLVHAVGDHDAQLLDAEGI